MPSMAKPHVVRHRKRMKLKSGKEKVYNSYSLRITVYKPEIKAVAPVPLATVGSKPMLSESRAKEIVKKFGKDYGFTLEDLRAIKKLKIVPDDELNGSGGERGTSRKTRGAVKK